MKNFILICEFLLILLFGIISSEYPECVQEMDICINGEGTLYGQKCIQWSKSNEKIVKIFEHTTLCQRSRGNYWCATNSFYSKLKSYVWDYCTPSECDKINFCGSMEIWKISENSINLNISFKIDILIILMESDFECSILAYCEDKNSAEHIMKTNFVRCKRLKIVEKENLILFDNLHQNKKHQFYILPILNSKLAGSVFKLMLKTKLSRPSIPFDIDINSISKTSFKITWNKSSSVKIFGEAKSYKIIVDNPLNETITSQSNEILIENLKPCQTYCFTLAAINEAGISNETTKYCAKTKPKFDIITNISIEHHSTLSRIIKWQYNNTFGCHLIVFIINISTNSLNKQIGTKEKNVILKDLLPNQFYKIEIIPKVNNQTGNSSLSQEFHTILVPSIPSDIKIIKVGTNSLQINWKASIQTNNFGPTDGYKIKINTTKITKLNATQTNILIDNLIPCRTYCLNILAFNFAWKSKPSNNICSTTKLGLFDEVIIERIIPNSTYPRLEWKYRNKLNCSNLFFKIEWHTENNFQIFSSQTSESFFQMDKLSYNQKYFIKVRPEFNNEYGKFSKPQEIFISNKKYSSKKYLLYLFISLLLISFFSFGYFKKVYILQKIKNIRNHKERPIAEIEVLKPQMCTSNFTRDNANKGKQDSLKTKVDNNQQEIDKENEISLTNKYKQLGVKAKAYENLKSLTTQIGELSENKSKNRFINILPYDQTRVKLIKESHGSDYINANYIPFMNNINKYEYIASQGPIEETISHFWQMIWENNISIIVMLTRTYEEDKFKCLQYWPNNKFQHEEFGQKKEFIVSILEENVKNAFVERKLKILNKEENLERSLIHLHMVEWFDYSAPKLEDFEQLLFRFQEIVLQKDYHPYLIHCSAGVGRTGTFIVLDRIIRELIDGNKNIDISHQILELRKYRKFMVQRAAQFIFIHDFYQYFLNKYTCPGDINEENIYFNST